MRDHCAEINCRNNSLRMLLSTDGAGKMPSNKQKESKPSAVVAIFVSSFTTEPESVQTLKLISTLQLCFCLSRSLSGSMS